MTYNYRKPTTKEPSMRTLEKWMGDSIVKATDGCKVEPDGICHHQHVSWLVYLGFV